MTAENPTAAVEGPLDPRRKRILFRSTHRGIREMDILFGGFIRQHVATLEDGELDEVEAMLDIPDQELFAWMTGRTEVPARWDTKLFRRILEFQKQQVAG